MNKSPTFVIQVFVKERTYLISETTLSLFIKKRKMFSPINFHHYTYQFQQILRNILLLSVTRYSISLGAFKRSMNRIFNYSCILQYIRSEFLIRICHLSLGLGKYLFFIPYCGIIIVHGVSMFMDFTGYPYQWNYILMNSLEIVLNV